MGLEATLCNPSHPPPSLPIPGTGDDRRVVGPLSIPGSSTLYAVLGALQLVAAITMLIAPYKLTEWFFRSHLIHADVLYEELWRILAALLLTGAATSYALRVASERQLLADPLTQRLQVGSATWALLSVVVLAAHVLAFKTVSWRGAALGTVIALPALLVPGVHLGMSGGFGLGAAADGLRVGLSNLFTPRAHSTAGFLYTLLTVLFTLTGAAAVAFPKRTLDWTFGYHAGANPAVLWQLIGGGVALLLSAVTFTLTERSVSGRLHLTIPKILNVGLLLAALFHVLEYGTLLVNRQGPFRSHVALALLAALWGLTLVTAILGLSAQAPSPAYEYEVLATEPLVAV